MQNTGNIRFRSLVEELRPAYVATSSRKEKAKMISDMVALIQSRNGRFLQRLCDKEVEELGLDIPNRDDIALEEHYVEMDDEEAAEKAKQAIRYVHYKKVPLEEERRKKRAADNNFLTGNGNNGVSRRVDYGGNSLASATITPNMTNQLAQPQLSQSNVQPGVTISPQLQHTDLSQLLASLQNPQSALAAQLSGNAYTAPHTQGHLSMIGNIQHHPNTIQRLASLLPNSNAALQQKVTHIPTSTLLDNSANQQNLPQQQAQMNVLLQSLLQQQANAQSNSVVQTILQQQQLNSALQTLRQQQQLTSTVQSLQQSQHARPDSQIQQYLQQAKTNSILSSLLSTPNANSQMGSVPNPLIAHPTTAVSSAITKSQPSLQTTNALLTSLLSTNNPQASPLEQSGKSLEGLLPSTNGTNVLLSHLSQQQQQSQGLLGTGLTQEIPNLAKNVSKLLAANTKNKNQGETDASNTAENTAKVENTAKRPKLSTDSKDAVDQVV